MYKTYVNHIATIAWKSEAACCITIFTILHTSLGRSKLILVEQIFIVEDIVAVTASVCNATKKIKLHSR